MHGRPRKPTKVEDPAAAAAKAENLRAFQTQLLHNHHNKIYTKEALEISAKLLEVNPEVYTAWNYRKLAVQSILESTSDPEEIKSVVNRELRVVEIALKRNPKCYGAWHHRKWVLQRELSPTDYELEFRLLDQLLKLDSRNFHGWNYRRFVAAMKDVPEDDELKFVTEKINQNFSNYSAWYNRSVLLSQLLKKKAQDYSLKKVLTEEFELVHNALFTDPDDQSGWFYYLWLLDQIAFSYEPLLVSSSWPANGSNIVVSNNRITDHHSATISDYVVKEYLPVVLCFNHPVKGLNSSIITVKSSFSKNEDIKWKPLSITRSEETCYWVAYLKMPLVKGESSNIFPVEVTIDYNQGCLSASKHTNLYRFNFTLDVRNAASKEIEARLSKEIVVWENDELYSNITIAPEVDCSVLFKQLQIKKDLESSTSNWRMETLSNEISLFKELLSLLDCKIAKLTLARLFVALDSIISKDTFSTKTKINSEEVLKLYKDLMESDTYHIEYYKDMHSVVLMDKITLDGEILSKHCWQNTKINLPTCSSCVFLRLNNLSLSRIGFAERLLWVQILDLSNNELKSIEGLEVMQLLSCLNLRGNRISSFSALEPLKLMPSLEVLNISYNQIGAHPIDTTRYLCASPLAHSTPSSCHIMEKHGRMEADYWEAKLLFQDMQLKQLDIAGNAIASKEFHMILVDVIPNLRWLDGTICSNVVGKKNI